MLPLRKLTEKSQLKFGKYSDCTVGNLLHLTKYYYLRWVYYNCSQINFNESVLNELHIDEEWRINKPGVAPEKLEDLNEYMLSGISGMMKLKVKSKLAKKKRRIKFSRDNRGRGVETKGVMQARNQGKI